MINEKEGCILIDVKVIPKSAKNEIEINGEDIKVKITAPPVDGKANKALVELIAQRLSLPKRAVTVEKGDTSRNKIIRIDGINRQQFLTALAKN